MSIKFIVFIETLNKDMSITKEEKPIGYISVNWRFRTIGAIEEAMEVARKEFKLAVNQRAHVVADTQFVKRVNRAIESAVKKGSALSWPDAWSIVKERDRQQQIKQAERWLNS